MTTEELLQTRVKDIITNDVITVSGSTTFHYA